MYQIAARKVRVFGGDIGWIRHNNINEARGVCLPVLGDRSAQLVTEPGALHETQIIASETTTVLSRECQRITA